MGAVAICARNLPRQVRFLADDSDDGPTLEFRPDGDHPPGVQQPHIWSEEYLRMANEELPFGQAPQRKRMRASRGFHRSSNSRWNAKSYACSCFLAMKVDGLVSTTCRSLSEMRYRRV